MNNKYELTNETKMVCGHTLHRIKAIVDFAFVKKGEIGGWIEVENNLAQDGDAWVSDNACVYGDAEVFGDAWVSDNACVYGDAEVFGDAWVYDNSMVYGAAMVCGNARVSGDAWVYDNSMVYGAAMVCGNARVSGNAMVYGDARVCGDARVSGNGDYIVFKNCWSSFRWFTYTRSNKKWNVGCFYGTGEELIQKAYADSEKSGKCYEAIVRAVEAIESAKSEAKGEMK